MHLEVSLLPPEVHRIGKHDRFTITRGDPSSVFDPCLVLSGTQIQLAIPQFAVNTSHWH